MGAGRHDDNITIYQRGLPPACWGNYSGDGPHDRSTTICQNKRASPVCWARPGIEGGDTAREPAVLPKVAADDTAFISPGKSGRMIKDKRFQRLLCQ